MKSSYFLVLLRSQISESVDDHTENQIENDNDENDVEGEIVEDTEVEQRFLEIDKKMIIRDQRSSFEGKMF